MKKKMEKIIGRLLAAVRCNPVEAALVVLFACFGCAFHETSDEGLAVVLHYSPALFLLAYVFNAVTEGTRLRFLYYLSGLFFVSCFWKEEEFFGASYWVTLAVVQLLYFVCDWRRDNGRFARKLHCYLRAGASACLLAGAGWFVASSVFHSIQYIFEVWQHAERRFVAYSLSIAFLGVMPLLFLMFNREEKEEWGGRLFTLLLNFVLSPALLTYAAILYLYFAKVVVTWSLPKGGVAFIVIAFVLMAFLLKSFQPYLGRRYYDWFYDRAGWAVLPALAMYWVGAFYRVNQYGYTEDRVYLVVVGAVLTGTALLFLHRRTGRYLYAALLALALLSATTYIPGMTAKDIERISQEKRGNYPVPEDRNGHGRYEHVAITSYAPLDVTGYATLQAVGNYDEPVNSTLTQSGLFLLRDQDMRLLFRAHKDSLLFRQMEKAGLAPSDSIPESAFPEILRLELDSALYVFGEISVTRHSPDSAYSVSYMGAGYYLKK